MQIIHYDLKIAINMSGLFVVIMSVIVIVSMIVAVVMIVMSVVMAIFRVGSAVNNFDGSVLLEPVNECTFTSVIIVINGGVFIVGRIEFDAGETFDFEVFNFVGSSIHLGDDQVLAVLESFSNSFEDGDKLLAVTAPGSV